MSTSRTRGRGCGARVVGLLATCLAFGSPVRAAERSSAAATASAEARTAARRELDAGNRDFESGAYAGALAAYRRAYVLVPSPNLLFNLAQAHRNLGHSEEAATFYQRFLNEATEAPAVARREAEGHLESLDARLARLRVVATVGGSAVSHGVELTVDGERREEGSFPCILRVLPGSHLLAARAGAGGPWAEERVVVRAGELRQMSFALAAPVLASQVRAAPPGLASPSPSPESGADSVVLSSRLPDGETAPSSSSSPSFGVSLRADIDAELRGAGWTGALTSGWGRHVSARGGGFFWPSRGGRIFGGFLGVRFLPWSGTVRPFAEVEGLLYGNSGAHPGGRAAAGLAWTAFRHLAFGAGVAFYRLQTGSTPADATPETSFWSPFVEAALF